MVTDISALIILKTSALMPSEMEEAPPISGMGSIYLRVQTAPIRSLKGRAVLLESILFTANGGGEIQQHWGQVSSNCA